MDWKGIRSTGSGGSKIEKEDFEVQSSVQRQSQLMCYSSHFDIGVMELNKAPSTTSENGSLASTVVPWQGDHLHEEPDQATRFPTKTL